MTRGNEAQQPIEPDAVAVTQRGEKVEIFVHKRGPNDFAGGCVMNGNRIRAVGSSREGVLFAFGVMLKDRNLKSKNQQSQKAEPTGLEVSIDPWMVD